MNYITKPLRTVVVFFIPIVLALSVIYFLGLSPFLKAQTNEMKQNAANLGGLHSNGDVDDKYAEQDLKHAGQDLEEKAGLQSSNSPGNKNDLAQKNNSDIDLKLNGQITEYKYLGSYIGDINLSGRDPFRKPEEILQHEEDLARPQKQAVNSDDVIDEKMEAIRRWPLSEYKLIGIIWDVKNPKAMIVDKKNTKHLLRKNYRIGNKNGLVSEIGEGSMIVLQEGVPVVISLNGKK